MKKSIGTLGRAASAISKVINYDFCPSFNPYVYWLKQPIGWVVCAAISSLMIGLFLGPQGFVLMWSFIALLAIGFVWPWISMKAISCELVFESKNGLEGEETVAQLKVKNIFPIAMYGLTVEGSFLQDIVKEDDWVAIGLEKVSGWSVSTYTWKLIPRKRGQLPATEPTVTTAFPFGIIKRSKKVVVQNKVVIWPGCSSLEGRPSAFSSQLAPDEIPDAKPGKDGEMIGVREFRQGDSFRHVHWAKTAQNNRFVVKEFQSCCRESVHVTLDLSYPSHLGTGVQSSFEWSIRTAASICKQLDSYQYLIDLDCIGLPRTIEPSTSNKNGIEELLDFLALLPEMENLQPKEKVSREKAVIKFRSSAKLKYLICTDRSAFHSEVAKDVKKIRIDSEQFQTEFDVASHLDAEEQQALVLSSPETASSELSEGWKSQYSYGI